MLLFIFKAVILLKISFLIVHSEKKLKLLLIPGLIHFLCQFGMCSGIFGQIITLEKFQLKGWQNDEYLNMHNV